MMRTVLLQSVTRGKNQGHQTVIKPYTTYSKYMYYSLFSFITLLASTSYYTILDVINLGNLPYNTIHTCILASKNTKIFICGSHTIQVVAYF